MCPGSSPPPSLLGSPRAGLGSLGRGGSASGLRAGRPGKQEMRQRQPLIGPPHSFQVMPAQPGDSGWSPKAALQGGGLPSLASPQRLWEGGRQARKIPSVGRLLPRHSLPGKASGSLLTSVPRGMCWGPGLGRKWRGKIRSYSLNDSINCNATLCQGTVGTRTY